MNEPFYDFQIGDEARVFAFVSVGPRTIDKEVVYRETNRPGFFNLALADVEADGTRDFYAVRNNGDLARIMATVAQTLVVFLRNHPAASVVFTGSTAARTRLYQIILAREAGTVAGKFVISGLKGNVLEPFVPNRDYDGFVVALEPPILTP